MFAEHWKVEVAMVPFVVFATLFSAGAGTSWQGLSSSAIVFVNSRRIPVVHDSTIVLSKQHGQRVQEIGVCKTGVLENCGVGLEKLKPVPRRGVEKCAVLTGKYAKFGYHSEVRGSLSFFPRVFFECSRYFFQFPFSIF